MTARVRRRRTLGAAGVVVLAVALGACTGEPSVAEPVTPPGVASPAATASSSPVPTVAVTAPSWTSAMDEPSVESALAVGQYFLELFPYVHATGDTTEWRRLSHPECAFCSDVAQAAENPPEGGYDDATVAVSTVQGFEVSPGVYSLEYQLEFVSESNPEGETDDVSMVLLRDADMWTVRGVDMVLAEAPDA